MELKECLLNRRSVRNFTDEPISEDIIKDIITAGIHAPSACNFAAWKFIVITKDTPNREVLANHIALHAPCTILVTYRNDLYVTGRKHKDYVQSAAAAIQNMLLYIASIGLGGVWICDLPVGRVIRKAFGIPTNFDVIACVAFGHPKKGKENTERQMAYHYGNETAFREHRRRYDVEQVMCPNTFRIVEGDCTQANYPRRRWAFNRIADKARRFWVQSINKLTNNREEER